MDETEFKPGDLVWLKSGSSKMTITTVNGPWISVVYCPYGSHVIIKDQINAIALRHADGRHNR